MSDHNLSWTSDGLVIKRYRFNAGDLARREWQALQLLHGHAPGLAPEPVEADLDAVAPWVTMSALPGKALGGHPLSWPQMRALGEALDRLHTCVPQNLLADVSVSFDPPRVLGNITSRLAAQPRPSEDATAARAYDDALRWLAGPEPNRLLSEKPGRAVLARGDHNLSNFLWDGHRMRLVDFEYAARADRCVEIAELVEHISARCTPDHAWQRFLDELDLSRAERQRLLTLRRLLAMMWLRLMLPGQEGEHRNPPGTLREQAQRVLDLMSE